MKVSEAVAQAKELAGVSVSDAQLVCWLSELDGKLAREFFRAEAWEAYDATEDLTAELLVPYPWDGLYAPFLESMIYYTTGEYQRYENARAPEKQKMAEFKAWIMRRFGRPGPQVLEELRNGGNNG